MVRPNWPMSARYSLMWMYRDKRDTQAPLLDAPRVTMLFRGEKRQNSAESMVTPRPMKRQKSAIY